MKILSTPMDETARERAGASGAVGLTARAERDAGLTLGFASALAACLAAAGGGLLASATQGEAAALCVEAFVALLTVGAWWLARRRAAGATVAWLITLVWAPPVALAARAALERLLMVSASGSNDPKPPFPVLVLFPITAAVVCVTAAIVSSAALRRGARSLGGALRLGSWASVATASIALVVGVAAWRRLPGHDGFAATFTPVGTAALGWPNETPACGSDVKRADGQRIAYFCDAATTPGGPLPGPVEGSHGRDSTLWVQDVPVGPAQVRRVCRSSLVTGSDGILGHAWCDVSLTAVGASPERSPHAAPRRRSLDETFDVTHDAHSRLYFVRSRTSRETLAFDDLSFAPRRDVRSSVVGRHFAPPGVWIAGAAAGVGLALVWAARARRAARSLAAIVGGAAARLDEDGWLHFDDGRPSLRGGRDLRVGPGPVVVLGAPEDRGETYRDVATARGVRVVQGRREGRIEEARREVTAARAAMVATSLLLSLPLVMALVAR